MCNMPHLGVHTRDSDISIAQIRRFVDHVKASHREVPIFERVRLIGGEPLLHPRVAEIAGIIRNELQIPGYIRDLDICTNGSVPIPPELTELGIRIVNLIPVHRKAEEHLCIFVSPADLGLPSNPCRFIEQCGLIYRPRGYFICTSATRIADLVYGGDGMFLQTLPDSPDDFPYPLEIICKHCLYGNPSLMGIFKEKYLGHPVTSSFRKIHERPWRSQSGLNCDGIEGCNGRDN